MDLKWRRKFKQSSRFNQKMVLKWNMRIGENMLIERGDCDVT